MGFAGPSLLGLTIWILTIAPTIVAGDHFCTKQVVTVKEEVHKCADIWGLIMNVNKTAYTFIDTMDSSDVRAGDKNQDCLFRRSSHDSVPVCCDGWTGNNCLIPDCQPSCKNGGQCVPPYNIRETMPHCECVGDYGGLTCEENLDEIVRNELMYCYVDSSCRSNLTQSSVMGISECCSGDFKGSWGSYGMQDCTPCQEGEVIPVDPDRDMVTCMTSGDDMYRSFNNIVYTYHSLCSVELLRSNEIDIFSMTDCDPLNKCACYKVVTIDYNQINGHARYILDNNTITVQTDDGETTINVELSVSEEYQNIDATGEVAWKYDRIQDTVYMTFTMHALGIRLDPDGTLMVTVRPKETTLSDVTGICGNWNLRPEDLIGLRTKLGAEKLFKDHINDSLPCGAGLAECPSESVEAEAAEACKPLRTLFHRCHRYVDLEYYMKKCIDLYCSSAHIGRENAEKAACNAISSYHTACFMETNEAINWRSVHLCPKQCKEPFIFNPLIVTACPPKCGANNAAYMRDSCETVPHAGCVCPFGYLRINYTCVAQDECQCVGDDQRYYDYGMDIDSADHCLTCKCGERGLWDCTESPDRCMATCKIMDRSHVTTFDGNSFAIADSCGHFILAESGDADLVIEMESAPCEVSVLGIRTCPSVFTIKYKGHEHTLEVTPTGFNFDNGYTRKVYIRQISDTYAVADVHGGMIRLIVSSTGVVQLKMQTTTYKGLFHGICGNLDGNKDNEFTAVTNAPMDKADFIAQFSKCSGNDIEIVEYSPVTSVDEFCSFLTSAGIPPTSSISVDDYKRICASMDEDAKCSLLESFALETDTDVRQEFPSLASCFPSCIRRAIDVCEANCRDMPFTNCLSQVIYDCGCSTDEYRNDDNQCKSKGECGCYDFEKPDVHIPSGEAHEPGCRSCICEESQLKCEDTCKSIKCVSNQRSQGELRNMSRTDDSCLAPMCPEPFHIVPECIDIKETTQLCFCKEGLFQTRDGICVDKCPCHDGTRWYNHGESFEVNCQKLTCNHGSFDLTETDDCSRTCIFTGAELMVKQFDSDTLKSEPIVGVCELVAFRDTEGYSVTFKPVMCQSTGTVCIYMVNIYTPHLSHQIQLKTTEPNTVTIDGKKYVNNIGQNITIVDTNYYLGILFKDHFAILWNRALTLMIQASAKLMYKTEGLCGNFSLVGSDDMIGSDSLPKTSLAKFAQSWRVNPDCHMPDDSTTTTKCDEDSRRYAWASHKCSIIESVDGPFGACKHEGASSNYYTNCLNQACNCDNGGDCECLCDAIAAYATFCGNKGHHSRWRNQRLCPMQCDGGAMYLPCGPTCPKACGGTSNSSLCDSLTCTEGCFCPEGYVRSDLTNSRESICIPESKCPCVDKFGRTIPAGERATIDCQDCECVNGSLSCDGDKCPKNCTDEQFQCQSGHCILIHFVCDGVQDCGYGEDEFDCEDRNCTGFQCKENDQCVPLGAVCNEKVDCLDGSDEESCEPTCEEYEFECVKGCIPKSFVCDSYRDCIFGEDEEGCVICPKNETHCNKTVCLPKNYQCDGHDDCGDGSDEVGCTYPTTTTPVTCEHEELEIKQPANYVILDGGPTFADSAFSIQGWTPATPGGGTLTISLEGDGYKMLKQLSFVVNDGVNSEISVVIETSSGKFDVQERVRIGEEKQLFSRIFNTEFVSVSITTSATISKLALKVCYEFPETTTVITTPTTEAPVVCEDGFGEVNDTFGASDQVGTRFDLQDGAFVPLPGSDSIEFTLSLQSNVIESEIYDVFFDVVDGDDVVVEEIGPEGILKTTLIELTDRNRFVYTPYFPEDLESIKVKFDAVETTSVAYLGAKGCVKVKVCELGDCFGICFEDIPDRCASECPTDDCFTTPERTTSTLAQTTVCASIETVAENLTGLSNRPYIRTASSAFLFINDLKDSDKEVIQYRIMDLPEPEPVYVLILAMVVPAKDPYVSTGGLKAFRFKVYNDNVFLTLGPDSQYVEGIYSEASEIYNDDRVPNTYFKIDNTVEDQEYFTFSQESMEVYDVILYSGESYGPGSYEPEAFWSRAALQVEIKFCSQPTTTAATTASTAGPTTTGAQPTTTEQTTAPGTSTAQTTSTGPTTAAGTSEGTPSSPFYRPESTSTSEGLTEITFQTSTEGSFVLCLIPF